MNEPKAAANASVRPKKPVIAPSDTSPNISADRVNLKTACPPQEKPNNNAKRKSTERVSVSLAHRNAIIIVKKVMK